jgi:PhnB protein
MSKQVSAIPEGCHSVTPYLIIQDAARALDFYKTAFGATEVCRMNGPDGQRVMHAEIKLGDSHIYLCDEFPNMGARSPKALGGSPVSIHLYTEDVDALHDRAVKAGATSKMPPANMFWGDRFAKLVDPFGHEWALATHVEDVTPEEMDKRAQAEFAKWGQKG